MSQCRSSRSNQEPTYYVTFCNTVTLEVQMTLLEIRTLFIQLSGRADLVVD